MADYQKYQAVHDPNSELDYGRVWGINDEGELGWLLENENIATSTWEIASDREKIPTLVMSPQGSGISLNRQATSIFLEGGTSGVTYKLTNEITTVNLDSSNRIERRTGLIFCCNK